MSPNDDLSDTGVRIFPDEDLEQVGGIPLDTNIHFEDPFRNRLLVDLGRLERAFICASASLGSEIRYSIGRRNEIAPREGGVSHIVQERFEGTIIPPSVRPFDFKLARSTSPEFSDVLEFYARDGDEKTELSEGQYAVFDGFSRFIGEYCLGH